MPLSIQRTPGFFTQNQLRMLRNLSHKGMSDRADVYRQSDSVPDGRGGMADDWRLILSNVPCRMSLISERGTERLVEDRLIEKVTMVSIYTFIFPHGTDLRPADRFVVAGRLFDVQGYVDVNTYSIEMRVLGVEII